MKKISDKIVFAIMICVIISAVAIGYISARSAEKALYEQVNQNMQSLSTKYAYEMETSFSHYEGIAQTIGTYIGATFDKSKAINIPMCSGYFQELGQYIQAVSSQNQGIISVGAFVNPNLTKALFGSWYSGEEEVTFDPYDAYSEFAKKEDSWYWHNAIVEKQASMWSDPYNNDRFQAECITYLYPILEEDEIIAYVTVDIPFQSIKEITSKVSGSNAIGVMLLDSDNRIVVDQTYPEGTLLSEAGYHKLEKALEKKSNGFISMTVSRKGNCFVGYKKLKNNFTVVVYSPESQLFKPIRNTNIIIALVSIIVISIAVILSIIVGKSISRPIYLVIEDLMLMETGNFTGSKHKKCLANKDETGKLAKVLDTIQVSMREMVNIVNENSTLVDELVNQLGEIVQQLMVHAEEVSQVAEELSAGMEETLATAENLSTTSDHLNQYMDEMKKMNDEGASSIEKISNKAAEINAKFNNEAKLAEENSVSIVSELQHAIEDAKKVEQIQVLTESILAIADETNLLALNTSIEAARVGAQGKGFGVIAQEIFGLAEQSQKTAQHIQQITSEVIDAVQKLSHNSERALDFMNDYIVNGYKKLIQVSQLYSNDSIKIKRLMDEYAVISNKVVEETKNLTAAFYELKNATTDGTTGTQELAGNAEQMSQITSQVQKQSQSLKDVFSKLSEAIGKFSV